MQKETAITQIKKLCWHLPGETEEIHEKSKLQ
jgi:hypothetical protein